MSILFTAIVSHGFIPDEFMKTVLLPIIKNKTGDVHDVNNYRPIALVTTCSKLFKLLLLDFLDIYLQTTDNQFGFKSKHATDMCIFAIKNVIEYYKSQNSPVYTCFLDASKAFDRVNHWTLFTKLINRKVPLLFVRIIVFWYRAQVFCITWGSCMSDSFRITNGVRQGGILSPRLFAVYFDELSKALIKLGIGCNVGVYINHLFYADDLCILAPTDMALQQLVNVCYDYGSNHDIVFNAKKSFCIVFKPKRFKLTCPVVSLAGTPIPNITSVKYLGVILTENLRDDEEILKQTRTLYAQGNVMLRKFGCCFTEVKKTLFQSYFTKVYCCPLWANYTKANFNKFKVAYNNITRRLLGYHYRDSASEMFVTNNLDSVKVLLRKHMYNLKVRIESSGNDILKSIYDNFYIRSSGAINKCWQTSLYTLG